MKKQKKEKSIALEFVLICHLCFILIVSVLPEFVHLAKLQNAKHTVPHEQHLFTLPMFDLGFVPTKILSKNDIWTLITISNFLTLTMLVHNFKCWTLKISHIHCQTQKLLLLTNYNDEKSKWQISSSTTVWHLLSNMHQKCLDKLSSYRNSKPQMFHDLGGKICPSLSKLLMQML